MKRWVSVLALASCLSGCNLFGDGAADPAGEATPTTAAPDSAKTSGADAKSKSHSSGARAVADETDDFVFKYAYPAPAGRIPELADLLDQRLEKQRSDLATESEDAKRGTREQGFPYNKHSYNAEWKTVADLPKWLSLSLDFSTYTGGAHGNYGLESLVWDKEGERAMDAEAMFTSPAALYDAFKTRYCTALDRERTKRRNEGGGPPSTIDAFNACPGIDELGILVGSSNGRTFNRLTVYAGPYVAGPYVEGDYRIDLSIDRAMLATVKPEFKDAFSARN
ncbi:MAG: DUF4163 domain-containing protein [Croceibacterium sp.]